jgi:predicted MFS family arabinose efflux permease
LASRARGLAIDVTPLRASRDFRLLWSGELVSQVGSQITLVALFVQVYDLTKSSAAVGVVGLVQLGPMVLVSLGFGPQIDRRDRRRLLLLAQTGLMAASVILLLGSRLHDPPLALLYGAAALNAGFMSIAMPTRSAMTPNLVGAELVPPAAALNQAMWNGAAVIGPAIGGLIVGRAGLTWAYGVDVGTYVVALGAAFALRPQLPHREAGEEEETGWSAVTRGVRYLNHKRVLQSTFTVDIVAMVFGMPRVLFPELADKQFHRGPEVVGWMFSAVALGALLGALSSGWVKRVRRPGLAILVAVSVWGIGIIGFGLSGTRLGFALLCLAIAGGADVISAVFRATMQQLIVPDALRGRLSAFNILVVAGGPRVGDVEAGLVAAATTPTFSVVSGGALCLAGVALIAATVPRFARWHVGDPP